MKHLTSDRKLTGAAIRELLRAGDPCRDGGELPPDEVQRMRRTVLVEARTSRRPAAARRLVPAAVAAGLLAAVLAGYALLVSPGDREPLTAGLESDPPAAGSDRLTGTPAPARDRPGGRKQQIQFVTANGTRVIWVLSSDLNL